MSRKEDAALPVPGRPERPKSLGGPRWRKSAAQLTKLSEAVGVTATPEECQELAAELGIDGVEELTTEISLSARKGSRYRATGRVRARLRQLSVVSLAPVHQQIATDIETEFWPEDQIAKAAAEAEEDGLVDPLASDDPEPLDGDVIDLGRLVYELIAVLLDPYPRLPDESFEWVDPGEERLNPFSVLKGRGERQ